MKVYILSRTDITGEAEESPTAIAGAWTAESTALRNMMQAAQSDASEMGETVEWADDGKSGVVSGTRYEVVCLETDREFDDKDWCYLG